MKNLNKHVALVLAALMLFGTAVPAFAEAAPEPDINSFMDTTKIPEIWDVTLNVNPDGTGDFASINSALQEAGNNRAASQSTKIILSDGVYREALQYNGTAFGESGEVPFIAIEAAAGAKPVITGAFPLTDWTYSKESERWTADLSGEIITALTVRNGDTRPDAVQPNPWPGIVNCSTGVFANGLLYVGDETYYRVLNEGEDVPGTFRLDISAGKITVWNKKKVNLIDTELACRADILTIKNSRNFVLRGLEITGSGWYGGTGINLGDLENILVEHCDVPSNRGNGIALRHIKNSAFVSMKLPDSGNMGIGGDYLGYIDNVLFKDVHVSNANWIGNAFAFRFWDPCGAKFMFMTNSTFVECSFNYNWQPGLWLDTGNTNITVLRCQFFGNLFSGLFLEANPGPIYVIDCESAGNSTGVAIVSTGNVTIDGCKLYSNALAVAADDESDNGRDGCHTQNITIKNSILASKKNPLISYDNKFNQGFVDTFVGENNRYFHPSPSKAFTLAQGEKPNGNLVAWQEYIGSDSGSTINKGSAPKYSIAKKPKPFVFMQYNEVTTPFKNIEPGGWWVIANPSITISPNGTVRHRASAFPIGITIGNYSHSTGKSWFLVVAWPTWEQWKEILFKSA
jgi:hypothetical protein